MVKTAATAVTVFALALAAGVVLGNRSNPAPATTTLPTATTTSEAPRALFESADETIVGPVVIVTDEPFLDRNQLVVGFDLFTRAPTGDAADVLQQLGFGNTLNIPPEELNTVYLDRWLLETAGDDIEGTAANPAARAARFDVGEDFDLASIESVSVASYAVLTPLSADIELGIGSESAPVGPGITARLLAVTEQANTIIQVELLSARGFNLDNVRVSGIGPSWLSAVREAEGRPRWNLTYDAERAPSPIALRVEGSVWVSVDDTIEVDLAVAE